MLLVQALHVAGAPAVKKHHPLFASAIKGVKQQVAQPISNQISPNAQIYDSHIAHPSQLPPAPHHPKEVGYVQVLLDNHDTAVNGLHTADGSSAQPSACISLQTQADSSPALVSTDQDMVTRAEKNCLTHQQSLQDSHKAYDSPLVFQKPQAKSTDIIKIPQSHPGAVASSLAADICSSMGHVTKSSAPLQHAHTDSLRPQESYSNTGQYQPLKGMAQSLQVSTPSICFCHMHATSA